jgi:pyrimidine-nucleoside phosphorylase
VIPSRVIEAKRDGANLPPEELEAFFDAYLRGDVPDYQMSAFLMATYFRGLDARETDVLVRCMLRSGSVLDLSFLDGPRVDKHSTGGVGDKVSIALAPLAAELGMFVPMLAGRGLGHTTGTVDKLEAIPGFRTELTVAELGQVLKRVRCAIVGQSAAIAPLDRRLYALRDVTATVAAIPLIAASIMSKKLAEGLSGLLLDVKVGRGAFIPEEPRALELARTMVQLGSGHGLPTVSLLTAMDRPLGRAIGNGLETAEALACLRGEGPDDLEALVLEEAVEMLRLAEGVTDLDLARSRAAHALSSGRALDRLALMVEAQGGDPAVVERPELLPVAPFRRVVEADAEGAVIAIDPLPLGRGVVGLGGGRTRLGEGIDLAVGFELAVRPRDRVRKGDPLGTVHARDGSGLDLGVEVLRQAFMIGEGRGDHRPLVSHRVTPAGVELRR